MEFDDFHCAFAFSKGVCQNWCTVAYSAPLLVDLDCETKDAFPKLILMSKEKTDYVKHLSKIVIAHSLRSMANQDKVEILKLKGGLSRIKTDGMQYGFVQWTGGDWIYNKTDIQKMWKILKTTSNPRVLIDWTHILMVLKCAQTGKYAIAKFQKLYSGCESELSTY